MSLLKSSRIAKMLLALFFAFFVLGLIPASADTLTISGTFTNGDSFTGTITTTPGTPGTITGGTLVVTGPTDAGTYTDSFSSDFPSLNEYLFQDSQGGSPSTLPYINLLFSDLMPISEAGLCTDATPCDVISQLRDNSGPNGGFAAYDLEAPVPTPEPGSLLLLAAGFAGLGWLFRKQRLEAI